jgi:SAM-dependent methyltransferase
MKTEPTTERIIADNYQSDQESYLLYLMHVATYKYSLNFVAGKKVLDYGCGSGYGTALISSTCSEITGVDVSSEAIAHAKSHFNGSNLTYMHVERIEVSPMPFPDSSFDVVLSFQVIEHVEDVPAYLRELERVLVPGGVIMIATPDRSSRLFSFQKPWNIWHLREYSQAQLQKELAAQFSDVNVLLTGGKPEILQIELNRTARMKWLLLPFTLPFIPDGIRKACLRFIKDIRYSLSSKAGTAYHPDFDESAISISNQEDHSIDLLAVARKNQLVN